jgi:small-conductance mechanosensitive channel
MIFTSMRPARRTQRSLAHLALLIVCVLAAPPLVAQEEGDPVAAAMEVYRDIDRKVQDPGVDTLSDLTVLVEQLRRVRDAAIRCVDDNDRLLERQRRQENALLGSAPPSGESSPSSDTASDAPSRPGAHVTTTTEHAALLAQLTEQRGRIEARKAMCRLLNLNATELSNDLLLREQRAIAGALLEREPNVVEVLRINAGRIHEWPRTARDMVRLVSGLEELGWFHWAALIVSIMVAILIGVAWQRHAPRLVLPEGEPPYTTNLMIATRLVLRARAPLMLSLVVINVYMIGLFLAGVGPAIFSKLAAGALVLLLLAMFSRILLDPPPPAAPLLKVKEGTGRPLSRLLQTLSLLILVALLLGEFGKLRLIDDAKLLLLAQFYVIALAVNVLGLIHFAGLEETGAKRLLKRGLPALAVVVVVVAMWLGYVNLSIQVLHGSFGTLLAILVLNLLSRLIEDLQDGLDTGRYAWQRAVRRAIGLGQDEPVPALGWLLLLFQIGLWILFLVVLLRIWGFPPQVIDSAAHLMTDGFRVGAVDIVPSRILWAVLILLLMLTAVRWIRGQLESRWLLRTRMERGAREAVATSFGYAGIAAVIMLSLSMAGIDFSNLALIAGALSVGIGFGLQNVVNNFISGLIMLFERPVKTGDWIVVGTTEGYVRRISIRTTTIETFDRSEVIVPNSELISNQVTNWMHNNNYGRFKVPVGVAYGSDTEKVRELMLQAAREHPKVVTGFPSWPDPSVLFLGFGDSALNFELRGIIYNVDGRLGVISDLNFAIDKAFREHGIEIPFPQRVVHMAKEPGPSPEAPATNVDGTAE